jgi:mono/diheme cytochrome c family protein
LGRWINRTSIGLFALAWLAAVFVYFSSMRVIERQFVPEVRNLPSVTSEERLEEGERLARVFGCMDACHGDRMRGQVIYSNPFNGRLVAPNLTRSVQQLTLPELESAVRQGIRPDGTSVFGMPASSLSAMTDRDLSAIFGFIRAYPRQVEEWGDHEYGLLTRYRIITGAIPAEAAVTVRQPWRETFRDSDVRLGEYLAIVACSQCHGQDLEGRGQAPSLDKIYDYDRIELQLLLQEGLAPGGREVGVMTDTARKRFVHLTEDEIDALFVYLKSRS